jgi:hypothetical protein
MNRKFKQGNNGHLTEDWGGGQVDVILALSRKRIDWLKPEFHLVPSTASVSLELKTSLLIPK